METSSTVLEALGLLRASLGAQREDYAKGGEHSSPSEEASGDEHLERQGLELARKHVLRKRIKKGRFLEKFSFNQQELELCYRDFSVAAGGQPCEDLNTPAVGLLLDNHWLVVEQFDCIRRYLSCRSFQLLPQLEGGRADAQPRIWDIVQDCISHTSGPLDCDKLKRFISAYQTVTPLNLRELWALPFMVRFALIEKVRRVAV